MIEEILGLSPKILPHEIDWVNSAYFAEDWGVRFANCAWDGAKNLGTGCREEVRS